MQDPMNLVELEAFRSSRRQFAKLISKMQVVNAGKMSHSELEDLLFCEGNELMRRLMQDHLKLRSSNEKRVDVIDHVDQVSRNQVRTDRPRNLETVYGPVCISRMAYSQHGVQSVHPLDKELNLPKDKYSHGLRKRLAEEIAARSFDGAVERIEQTTGGKVPKRQAEQLTTCISQDFDEFYKKRECHEQEDSGALLAMSLDGKGIVMRHEDLRESTRKAAEKKPQERKRLGAGEKRNRKRFYRFSKSLTKYFRMLNTGIGQYHHKFFATITARYITFPNAFLKQVRNLSEHLIASGVAVSVIHTLEVIQIHHTYNQLVFVTLSPCSLPFEYFEKIPPVIQAC